MILRPIDQADIPQVLKIETECFVRPWTAGDIEYAVLNERHFFVGAFTDDRTLCGYGSCEYVLDEGNIGNIATAENFRRRGIAKEIMNEIMRVGSEKFGTRAFFLEVRSSNAAAICLYEKLGFVKYAVREGYYTLPDGREDAIMMKYLLSLD